MLQKPVGCQRMSVNTLLCDTLGLADLPSASLLSDSMRPAGRAEGDVILREGQAFLNDLESCGER